MHQESFEGSGEQDDLSIDNGERAGRGRMLLEGLRFAPETPVHERALRLADLERGFALREVGDRPINSLDRAGDTTFGTCSLQVQWHVLRHFLPAATIPWSDAVDLARQEHWLDPVRGTSSEDAANLVHHYAGESLKIEIESQVRSVDALSARLSEGQWASIPVNAGALWNGAQTEFGRADHRVLVTGAKVAELDGQKVVVALYVLDSAKGRAEYVSARDFERAWDAGDWQAVFFSRTSNGHK